MWIRHSAVTYDVEFLTHRNVFWQLCKHLDKVRSFSPETYFSRNDVDNEISDGILPFLLKQL